MSCSTAPLRQDSSEFAEWEARALVKDLKNSKTVLVNIDFFAQKEKRYRMDVTTPIGIHVTSFVLNDKNVSYIVPQKKIFYSGSASSGALANAINLSLDPKILMNVLFDIPPKGNQWSCENDKNGIVSVCSRTLDRLKITWGSRVGKEKTVQVSHPDYQIEMKFHKYKAVNSINESLFQIKQPEGFKKL